MITTLSLISHSFYVCHTSSIMYLILTGLIPSLLIHHLDVTSRLHLRLRLAYGRLLRLSRGFGGRGGPIVQNSEIMCSIAALHEQVVK